MDYAIIFDTETTTGPEQALTFGFFRFVAYNGSVNTLAEGVIYADDLPDTNRDGFDFLKSYAAENVADISGLSLSDYEPSRRIEFLSRTEFVDKWIYGFALKKHALIVGFNLPFDISRIAIGVRESRGDMLGGFTFDLSDNERLPSIRIKHLDSKKSLIGWTYRNLRYVDNTRGRFLDLRTLAFALTSRGHSLDSACRAFGVESGKSQTTDYGLITVDFVNYARQDVKATAGLYDKLMTEYERHPIGVAPERLLSPASLAKAYYRQMGLRKPLERTSITDSLMGSVMTTFYGARAECKIRRSPVFVRLVDFTSMYPTTNALMRLWDHLAAKRLGHKIATQEVIDLLDRVTIDDCFNRDLWPQLVGIARIVPDNDVVPVRAQYGPDSSFNIGINYLSSSTAQWYAIPDLIASKILTGKAPRVIEAVIFTAEGGTDPNLSPVNVRSDVIIDPQSGDFFRWVIEQRKRSDAATGQFLKILANAGSYGLFAEITRVDSTSVRKVNVHSDGDHWQIATRQPETPGEYCYPPIATCITASARLMLAMLERCVTEKGGCWAFADTDSMAITGLDGPTVDSIRDRFNLLNPYDRLTVPDILKIEFTGMCFAVSAKRYVLYRESGEIVKVSEHGLGHVTPPRTGWINDVWRHIVTGNPLDFADLPAIAQWPVTTPDLYRTLKQFNRGKNYRDSIKPFSFATTCFVDMGRKGSDKLQLITSFTRSPEYALTAKWVNKYEPNRNYKICTSLEILSERIKVKTYGELVGDYALHPEWKSAGTDGEPAGPHTVGVLERRRVTPFMRKHIGKESHNQEQREAGLFSNSDTLIASRPQWYSIKDVIFRILYRKYNQLELAKACHVSARRLRDWENGDVLPTNRHQKAIITLAIHSAMRDLKIRKQPTDYVDLFRRWATANDDPSLYEPAPF